MRETENWAKSLVVSFNRPCVVLLSGPLGSGKTQMVRWFMSAMGVSGTASPTFAIHQEYKTPGGEIDHVDLYRTTSDDDLESTGFWDLLRQPSGLVFVEWADRLPESVWPKSWKRVFITITKGVEAEERNISIKVLEG